MLTGVIETIVTFRRDCTVVMIDHLVAHGGSIVQPQPKKAHYKRLLMRPDVPHLRSGFPFYRRKILILDSYQGA